MRRLAVVGALLPVLFLGAVPTQAQIPESPPDAVNVQQVDEPLVVMTIGDSTVTLGHWQAEFCRILDLETDLVCDLRNEAVGGTTCKYWTTAAAQLVAKLVQHQPDLVIFTCGTNDNIYSTAWGEPETSWAFRATVEMIKTTVPSVKIVPVLLQYPDPLLLSSAHLVDWIPVTNDRLYVQMLLYPSWFPGIVDWQFIPSNATYLDTTGFHATLKGDQYRGRLVYDRIHAGMGWPAASEPALCDLYGHRKWYARPNFTPCS